MAPQLANYKRIKQRIKRTLNFGGKAPRSLHLPLTDMMVEYFNQASPFDYLKPDTSACISSSGFTDTCALVVAMCYLERMRQKKKETFEATNPAEMYLPALILASKYLHDSDQEERVADEDWASMVGLEKKELSRMEWTFIQEMDWDVKVDIEQFEQRLAKIESWVASDFLSKYSFGTYNELTLLSSHYSEQLLECLRTIVAAVSLSLLIYSAALASLLTLPLAFPPRPTNFTEVFPTCPSPSSLSRHAALLSTPSTSMEPLVIVSSEEVPSLPSILPSPCPSRPSHSLALFLFMYNSTVHESIMPKEHFFPLLLSSNGIVVT